MLGMQYVTMARNHWREWLPKMYQEMQENGTLQEYLQKASADAAAQVASLMAAGAQQHEAEEIVLPETIMLPPEPETRPKARRKK